MPCPCLKTRCIIHLPPCKLLLILFAAACAHLSSTARAERRDELDKQLAPLPPFPVAQKVRVQRGGNVEIPLVAKGKWGETVRFFLRSQPKHGSLGPLRQLAKNQAQILYTHFGEPGAFKDSFTFAARSRGTPMSASASVEIEVTDLPPRFIAPLEVDFGTVVIGDLAKGEILLKNEGGGEIDGYFSLKAPWYLDSEQEAKESAYRLGWKSETRFPIFFAPTKVGEYSDLLRYSGGTAMNTLLKGRAIAPISIEPEKIDLPRENSKEPRCSIELKNNSWQPLEIFFLWPTELRGPSVLRMRSGEKKQLIARLQTQRTDAFERTLTVRTAACTLKVPVSVSALPAKLALWPEDEVTFSAAPADQYPLEKKVFLTNLGGVAAWAKLDIPSPFSCDMEKRQLELAPGHSFPIALSLSAPTGETLESAMRVSSDKEILKLPLKALRPNEKRTADRGASIKQKRGTAPLENQDRRVALWHVLSDHEISDPAVRSLKLIAVTRSSICFSWRNESEESHRYAIQTRRLDLDSQWLPQAEWLPQEAKIERKDNGQEEHYTALLTELQPGTHYTLRVIGMDAEERAEPLSPPLQFATLPGNTGSLRLLFWGAAVAFICALVALAFWKVTRKPRGRTA